MLQKYYKLKAKYYIYIMDEFNKYKLKKIDNFNDAAQKYYELKNIYNKAKYYINKLPYGYIDNEYTVDLQIRKNLDILYNESITKALNCSTENKSLNELKKIKNDLNNSYNYGIDNIISEYYEELLNIIKKHKIIYKNYKIFLNAGKENEENNYKDLLYNNIIEFIITEENVSASILQRKFRIDYKRAAQIIDQLETDGLISSFNGNGSRKVLTKKAPKSFIDFDKLYGTDYEAIENEKLINAKKEKERIDNFNNTYIDMAQSYFDKLGLKIKFDKNKTINKQALNNSLFTNAKTEDIEKLINNILCTSVPKDLKLILVDFSQVNLFEYNRIYNLLEPVITDYPKTKLTLEKLEKEMNKRYKLFLENRVKNIDSYNEISENKLPYIVVVINEIFELIKFENSKEIISELLLNCKKAGIIFMCFSKFNKKNIQMMMLEDLFEIYNSYSNYFLESETNFDNIEINNINKYMNGFDFEKYTEKLLKANNFTKVEVTQCSNNFGVDVIAFKDDIKYAIQCKKYSSPVGIKAVQEVIGSKSMNDCHVAVVLTNSRYTNSAKELAKKNNVLLWDKDKLIELIQNMNKKTD